MKVEVSGAGEVVSVVFGNFVTKMHYETAFRMSDLMQQRAHEAKKAKGHKGRTFLVTGTLHDASHKLGPDAGQPFDPGRVYPVNRDLTAMQKLSAHVEPGSWNVVLSIGRAEMKMHYMAALQISQLVRLRAKDCKRRAGDLSRHWSEVNHAYERKYGAGGE